MLKPIYLPNEVYFSNHALIRFMERFGYKYWGGKKIIEMSEKERIEIIKHELHYPIKIIKEAKHQYRVYTGRFVAIIGTTNNANIIITIFSVKSSKNDKKCFLIEEILTKEDIRQMYLLTNKKATSPSREGLIA